MPTLEIRCTRCGNLKWPTLPDRPEHYVCVLCRAMPPAEGPKRRAAAQRAALTKQARQGTA